MKPEQRARVYEWVSKTTELPMLILSALVVPLLLAPSFVELSSGARTTLTTLEWAIWSAFAIELVLKTYLSASRARYLRDHWFDVLIVALPFLRPLRIVNSMRTLRFLRALRFVSVVTRLAHTIRHLLRQNGLGYVLMVGLLVLTASALIVLQVESGPDSSIRNFPDALWWAAATITTVGYGDHVPVTPEGRAIAVFLMVGGITIFSILTANLAAFFNRPIANDSQPSTLDLIEEIRQLRKQVAELAEQVSRPQTEVWEPTDLSR